MPPKLRNIIRSRPLQHLIFWAFSYYVLLTIFTINPPTGWIDHIYTLLFHISLLFAVYVNGSLLIPHLLGRKHYILYGVSVAALLFLAGLLNEFTFDVMADRLFPGYYFISYYNYYDILRFIAVYLALTTLLKFSRAWFQLQEKEARMARLEKENIGMELKMLRSQVHPHFLFNTLNNIYGLVQEGDERAADSIVRLSDILRYILYEANQPMIALEKELAILEAYTDLMKMRSDDPGRVEIKTEGEPGQAMVPPLLLLPLLENCFKHGDGLSKAGTYISLKVVKTASGLIFDLRNSISGGREQENEPGIGLENVKRRLDLLYPGRHSFTQVSDEKEFRVTIEIDPDNGTEQ